MYTRFWVCLMDFAFCSNHKDLVVLQGIAWWKPACHSRFINQPWAIPSGPLMDMNSSCRSITWASYLAKSIRSEKSFRNHRCYMDVSENSGTPQSSILIGFSIINHPFWVPLFLEIPVYIYIYVYIYKNPRKVDKIPSIFTWIFFVVQVLHRYWLHRSRNQKTGVKGWKFEDVVPPTVEIEDESKRNRSPNFYESMLVGTRSNLTKPCRLILDSHPGCFLKMVVPPISHR